MGFREFRSNSGSYNIYHNEIKKNIKIKIVVIAKKDLIKLKIMKIKKPIYK